MKKQKAKAWYNINPVDVEGRGWQKTESPFDRIPAKVKEALPEVWAQSHSTTGMCLFFESDSPDIYIREELGEANIGEANFNVTAHDGVDLYVYDEAQKRWRWGAATPHFVINDTKPEYTLIADLPPQNRRCRLYLPLRNKLLKLAIGTVKGASFKLIAPRTTPPLVYYGTSIIHGAFSIRSGLGIAQILGRKLDLPLINLGFSGVARLEKTMAELLTELKPKILIIDPFHNLDLQLIQNNLEGFLDIVCTKLADVPIVILSAPQHLQSWLKPGIAKQQTEMLRLFRKIIRANMEKYQNLHFIDGKNFYGDEVSMDGVHPNDDAFANMAKILEPKLRKLLKS